MGEVLHSAYSRDESAKAVAKRLGLKRGDLVETKSFEPGYRGSWFACGIKVVDSGLRNHVRYKLEYVHFPDEAHHWCQAYQQRHRGKDNTFELMVRPVPPPVMSKKEARTATISGPVVIRKRWQIGDLVDWRKENVWWEATVVGILPGGKIKVTLFSSPDGEGGTYVTEGEQLRPSLIWVSVGNWAVAVSKANGRAAGEVVQLPYSGLTQDSGSDLTGEDTPNFLDVTPEDRPVSKASPGLEKLRRPMGSSKESAGEMRNSGYIDGHSYRETSARDASKVVRFDEEGSGEEDNVRVYTRSNGSAANRDVGGNGDGDLDMPLIPPSKRFKYVPTKDTGKDVKDDVEFADTALKPGCGNPSGSGASGGAGNVEEEPDYDSEYLEDILYIKRLIFWKRNRKFKRYRKQVNRAIRLVKRMKSKNLLGSIKIEDSSNSWSEPNTD